MADIVKVVIEQSDDEGMLSRVTAEWGRLQNWEANTLNIGVTQSILDAIKGFAEQKKAANPTG